MNTPWAVILCKFADDDSEPFPRQYYEDLFTTNDTGSPWNMIRYFDDWSHGNLDLTGTQVFGWFKLTQTVAVYNANKGDARDALIGWARDAAIAKGADLSPFFSTVVCTNLWKDVGEASNGVVAQGLTATPAALGQEMGHVYGLSHSRIDGSDEDYKDPWDVMSGFGDYATPDPEFQYIGPGLNAWNMRSRGWLDETRVWKTSDTSIDETITLRPLGRRDLDGWLAAETPGGYLAEFRLADGWDKGIPQSAVLIHRFDNGHSYLMRGNAANPDLVAGDSFGDPVPASPYTSLFTGFERVEVLAIDEGAPSATLRIQYQAANRVPIPLAIDPVYLIFFGTDYVIWEEIKHPHVPKVSDIREILNAMTPAQQRATLGRAKTMIAYGKSIEKAMGVRRGRSLRTNPIAGPVHTLRR